MLLFTKGLGDQNFVVTLTEKATIPNPNFLFVFKAVTGQDEKKVIFRDIDNLSTSPERYDEFSLKVDAIFTKSTDAAQWQYRAYQLVIAERPTPPVDTLVLLETGKMQIRPAVGVTTKSKEIGSIYKAYDGN